MPYFVVVHVLDNRMLLTAELFPVCAMHLAHEMAKSLAALPQEHPHRVDICEIVAKMEAGCAVLRTRPISRYEGKQKSWN